MLCAAALSMLATIYATGRLTDTSPNEQEAATEDTPQIQEWRTTVFPEQSRAVEDLLKEILARQESLDRQKEQLDTREARVRQEEILLQRMRDELTSAGKSLEDHLTAIDASETKNTRKLAEFYAKMDAQNAARLLSEMENDQAARILYNLADRQAGAIMDAAVALGNNGIERAVAWSDLIRKQKDEKAIGSSNKAEQQ
jgi:flagellar motility protein MotE (MotC chaperone)